MLGATLLITISFEAAKSIHFSNLGSWLSHCITVGVSSAVAMVIANLILCRYRYIQNELIAKVRERDTAEANLRRIMMGARCLLWQAQVTKTPTDWQWDIHMMDEEAAQRWFPIAIETGMAYPEAWHLAKLSEDRARMDEVSRAALVEGDSQYRQEFRCRLATGEICWLREEVQIEREGEGIWRLVGICTDITERKQFEEQLAHQALHDALTGLPNRLLFMDRLKGALARNERLVTTVAVIFVDLDNFKGVNDSLGHDAGDRLLKTMAARLYACLRSCDTLARQGGDEFTILLDGLHAQEEAIAVAERILEQLQAPIDLGEREVFAGASLGIAMAETDGTDAERLLCDADMAMYQAKMAGKSGYALFDNSMNAQIMERREYEYDLREAVLTNSFHLVYQPILDLATHMVFEVEALLRWEHPQKGLISPARFIPIAEETGLIVSIGEWVLFHACAQMQQWEQEIGCAPRVMAVNVSAKQLQHPDFVDMVRTVLNQTRLAPDRLKLEITESLMISNFDATMQKLHQLKALGVRLAIDDFGTGYSSMAYLSTLPVDTLKIDRSFVQRLGNTENNAVVKAIIGLAKTLKLEVTSEGIETPEQLAQLLQLGSDMGQGFYFARPLATTALSDMLRAHFGRHDASDRTAAQEDVALRAA
jgi:diguanylate cyclase (GGDEF)-like protein